MNNSVGNLSSGTQQPPQMDFIAEPLGLRICRLTVYVIIFLLATVGNALVIFVVYKTRELHTGKLCPSFTFTFLKRKAFKRIREWHHLICKLLPHLMPVRHFLGPNAYSVPFFDTSMNYTNKSFTIGSCTFSVILIINKSLCSNSLVFNFNVCHNNLLILAQLKFA